MSNADGDQKRPFNFTWNDSLTRYAIAAAAIIVLIVGLATGGTGFGSGSIFVGSPEVYTRERLVNDRYDQDYWLHAQLVRLDKTENLLTGKMSEDNRGNVTVKAQAAPDPPGDGKAPDPAKLPDGAVTMPFDQEFVLRAGVRDAIRQQILENLLDDRHDLTGNSVYGLKFDITVLPGLFSSHRAFARVLVEPKNLFGEAVETAQSPVAAPGAKKDLPEHVKQYYEYDLSDIRLSPTNPLHLAYTLYDTWLADVEARLNNYADQISGGDPTCTGEACADDAVTSCWQRKIIDVVETVLGLDDVNVDLSPKNKGLEPENIIELPQPWRSNLEMSVAERGPHQSCAARPRFSVRPITDAVYLIDKATPDPDYLQIDDLDDKTGIFVSNVGAAAGGGNVYLKLLPRYTRIREVVQYAVQKQNPQEWPLKENLKVRIVQIPSGFFNFVESVNSSDSYTYALFPKNEVSGFLIEQSNAFGVDAAGGVAAGSGSASLSRATASQAVRSVPKAVGFSDARTAGKSKIEFGWEIGSGEHLDPTQKSVLALVAVPAWTNKLSVTVTVGWLGVDSTEHGNAPYSFDIPIPPDYEAFDSFVGGSRTRRGPRIIDDLMTGGETLVSCEPGSILIPGYRLWRSTVVTVGSERADRITVLPNMRGIIASFTKYRPAEIKNDPSSARLSVWTSEGTDNALRDVVIMPPSDVKHCSPAGNPTP